MRVFKTKWFARYAKREKITDKILSEAVKMMERGLVDADLGGNVFKQRIPREGQGKSKGYRTLVAYQFNKMVIFMYGFAKSERENIENAELESLKEIATGWLNANNQKIKSSLENGILQEVNYEK